jgi:hypothetical protein
MKVLIEDTGEIREIDLPDQADWPVHYDVAGPGGAVYDVIRTPDHQEYQAILRFRPPE